MKCYTLQTKIFIEHLLSLFDAGYEEISCDNIDTDDFVFYQNRSKDIYDGEDFIYTFYNKSFDSDNGNIFMANDYEKINHTMRYYWATFDEVNNFNRLGLLELDIPDNANVIFGEIDGNKIITKDLINLSSESYELILSSIKKEWIVEYYTYKSIPSIPIHYYAIMCPHNYTYRDDRVLTKEVPLVMNRTMIVKHSKLMKDSDKLNILSNLLDKCEDMFYSESHRFEMIDSNK